MTRERGLEDQGFSLVELIFYVVILGIITTGIAAIFINMSKTQLSVTNQVDSTTRGQLVSSQVEKAMRNAIAFEVTNTSLSSGLTSGPVLLVATGFSGSNACMAFNFAGGNAQLTSTSGGAIPPAPWPVWQQGIVQHPTSSGNDPFFAQSGSTVKYSFDVTDPNSPTVHFQGSVYMRNPSGGTQTCF
jgi:hypothetical protein